MVAIPIQICAIAWWLVWVGRAALEYADPIYWDPDRLLDYIAILGTSLAFLFLSGILWALYRRNPLPTSIKQQLWREGMVLVIVLAAVVSVSNIVDDALGVKAIEVVYGYGGLGMMLGLLLATLGAFLHDETRFRVGWFLLACVLGIVFADNGGWFVVGFAFWILAWMARPNSIKDERIDPSSD